MALEEKIAEWAKGRPNWQRMVLRRVAEGKPLSHSEYDTLVDDLVAGKTGAEAEFALKDVPHTQPEGAQVQLISISDPDHVNALDSKDPLTFDAKGLTVVYGDNGSGKSGYARILKSVARARTEERVLTDVFRDTTVEKPTAKLDVTIGSTAKVVPWPVVGMPELRSMAFYDAPSGAYYIDTELEFLYKPPALFVLDGLVKACLAVRERVDKRLNENTLKKKDLPVPPEPCKNSDAAKFLVGFSVRSTIEALDALIAKCDKGRIEELKKREGKLRAEDTAKEKARLERDADKLDALAVHVTGVEKALGTESVTALVKLRDSAQDLTKAADALARQFVGEPLTGIGSGPWKELWESARKFSEEQAYKDRKFPTTGDDALCVLCLQELDAKAKDRFTRFEKFVKDDTQAKLKDAQNKWKAAESAVRKFECLPAVVETHLADLKADYAGLVAEVKTLLENYKNDQKAILDAIKVTVDLPKEKRDAAGHTKKLQNASKTARETAAKLATSEGIEEQLLKLAEERTTLELLEEMKKKRADIVGEIERLKERATLEGVKSDAATTGITKTITEYSEEHITDVVRDRFTRESDRLKLERITISRTRATKGALLHQTKLVQAKQTVPVKDVFSEGEKTALGLAGFFTEAELDGSKSSLIFDDPVSSLDHVRRGLVAARIAELAKARQVIVFTHDAAFVADLKVEGKAHSVDVSERAVCRSRGGEKKPGRCETKMPWKIQDVAQRFDELRRELARIKKESGGWDNDKYEREVASWAGGLSETWERIFSQEIIGQILGDGGTEVRVLKVRLLVAFSEVDFQQFEASYKKVSQWAKRHDKAVTVNYVAPEVELLEKELELVRGWFDRVRKYVK